MARRTHKPSEQPQEESNNGQEKPKTEKQRVAKARKKTETTPPETTPPKKEDKLSGRLASDVNTRSVEWLWHPWIARGVLTLVSGNPGVGKSTFLASLVSFITGGPGLEDLTPRRKGKVVFLPGYEEDIEVMTIPRLQAAGADLNRVMLMERPGLTLIKDRDRIARVVKELAADLLLGDPIDSYMDEGVAEEKGQQIRPLLEAAVWIARETGAAVVFTRHPGKDPANIMPGSRQWRAVPRTIIELSTDGGIPPRYSMSLFKDSLGARAMPRAYSVVRESDGPARMVLAEDLDYSAEELQRNSQGPTGRYKLVCTCKLIRWLFSQEEEPTRVMLGEECRRQGLGEDTVLEAMRLLGVKSVPPSERGLPWKLVRTKEEWPAWLPEAGG